MIASATFALPMGASAQTTITVGPTSAYKTIQSALNAASAGDIIIVNSGTYYENVAVDKAVTIRAASGATPIVDARSKYPAFRVHANNVRIEGMTVRNAGPLYSGFYVTGSDVTIANNKVSGCGWGIYLTRGSGSTVVDNIITGSTTDGIGVYSSNGNLLQRNTVTGGKNGITLSNARDNIVAGSHTSGNAVGLKISGTGGNRVFLNDFLDGASVSGTNSFNTNSMSYPYRGKTYTSYMGNYWGGYKGADANGNGIGDTAYRGVTFTDYYPLMEPWRNYGYGGTTPTPAPTATPRPTGTPTATPGPTATPAPTATPSPGNGPIQISPTVPSNAVRVSSQAQINALPAGANAVLTADLSSLTISKQINLFAAGHRVGSVTMTAAGARLSGAVASAVYVKAPRCIVDHCTITATGSSAVRVDRVNDVQVLSNVIRGSRTSNCIGIYATNLTGIVIDGNTLSGAYYCIYTYGVTNPQISYNHVKHESGYRQGNDYFITYTYGGVFRNNKVDYDPYHGPGSSQDHNGMAFDRVFGMTMENNEANGHYYCFKVYNSKDCTIQNNVMYKGGACLRVGFYCERITVRNNKITGDAAVGYSDVWINDGVKNCVFENNEISYMKYGFKVTHYPPGTKYLYGYPSLPCSNIVLKNNYIHHCTVALCIADKGATIESGNRIENCKVVRNMY